MKMASETAVQLQGDVRKDIASFALKLEVLNQEAACQKRACKLQKHRPTPYERSPSGSTCTSSDESTSEHDSINNCRPEQRKEKRLAANSRERKRMHTVNSAFDQLRELVPTYPSNRKLSKIDTLKLACAYINDLTSLLRSPSSVMHGDDVKLYREQFGRGSPTSSVGVFSPGIQLKTEFPFNGEFSPNCYDNYQMQVQPTHMTSVSACNGICYPVCL